MGRLSAAASSSLSLVTIAQEKSRAMLSTPERPVLSKVLAILRAMPCKRLLRRAMRTPSAARLDCSLMVRLPFRSCFVSCAWRDGKTAGGAPNRRRARIDDDGGHGRFDDRRPLDSLVGLHRLETADARSNETMAREISAPNPFD